MLHVYGIVHFVCARFVDLFTQKKRVLPLSGYFNSGSPNNQGTNGNFWSSTRNNNTNMYILNLNTSGINPANNNNRNNGNTIRCILGS